MLTKHFCTLKLFKSSKFRENNFQLKYYSTQSSNNKAFYGYNREKEESLHPKYKELRRKRDHILRTFTPKVRIAVINNTHTAKVAKEKHNLSDTTAKLLGRAMAAASLIASDHTGEERVEIRYNAEGPIKQIVAEAIRTGEVRGYVSDPQFYMTPSAPIGFALRAGTFTVTKILYGAKTPYTSTVPIAYGDVSSEIINYYRYSEQIPGHAEFETIINHKGEVEFSGGFIIEALPPIEGDLSNANYIDPYIERLKHLPPLSVLFGKDLHSLRDVLDKIAPGEIKDENIMKLLTDFYCRCSKDRMLASIQSFPKSSFDTFLQMMENGDRNLKCNFCSSIYRIEDEDIEQLKKNIK